MILIYVTFWIAYGIDSRLIAIQAFSGGWPMPKNEPTKKKPPLKLRDLPPKKEARGGGLGFSKNPPFPIPPPGFISPRNGPAEQHR
jgi:hypothetical protein